MRYLPALLLGAAVFAAGPATGVEAADFRFPREPAVPVPAPIPIPQYSSWYVRGDIAWPRHEDPDLSLLGAPFTDENIDDIWGLGAGIGYSFSDHLRGDITLDYRRETEVSGITGTSTHTAVLSSTVFLANLYYDILSRNKIAPYVGVGLGFSYNETEGWTITPGGGATGGDSNADLALSAMAGFSYRMQDNWLFDMGYRYLYLGDAATGATGALKIDDIQAHELRVGVRYEIN